MTEVKEYYTVEEFAKLTGYKETTIRVWISQKKLQTQKTGGWWVAIPHSELVRIMEEKNRVDLSP